MILRLLLFSLLVAVCTSHSHHQHRVAAAVNPHESDDLEWTKFKQQAGHHPGISNVVITRVTGPSEHRVVVNKVQSAELLSESSNVVRRTYDLPVLLKNLNFDGRTTVSSQTPNNVDNGQIHTMHVRTQTIHQYNNGNNPANYQIHRTTEIRTLPTGYYQRVHVGTGKPVRVLEVFGKNEPDELLWQTYKVHFNKIYKDPTEEARRFAIFKLFLKGVREHNKKFENKEVSHPQVLTDTADLTQQDFEIINNFKPVEDHENDGVKQYAGLTQQEFENIHNSHITVDPNLNAQQAGFIPAEVKDVPLYIEPLKTDENAWEKFKVKFGKIYSNKNEETRRFKIFKNTLKRIREQNDKYLNSQDPFYLTIYQFADLEPSEHPYGLITPTQENDGPKPLDTDENEWEKFKIKFNKVYKNKEEETHRFNIFIKNLKGIREHNAKYLKHETSYYQGMNPFADLEEDERPHPDPVPDVYQPQPGWASYMFKSYRGPIQRYQTGFIPDPNNKTPYHVAPLESDEKEWEKFKVNFGKTYPTKEEETRRFDIFKNTLKTIREQNEKYFKGESTYYFSVNQFADLEPKEHPNGLTLPISYPLTDPIPNEPEPLDTDEKEWEKFKVNFNKVYKTKEEETRRYNIFIKNLKAIREQNAKYLKHETGYYQGVNLFADLEEEERPHGVIAIDHTVSHLHKLHPDTVPNVYQPHSGLVSYKIKYYSGPIQRYQTGFIPDPNNKTPYHVEPLESDEKEWEKFKVHFGKTYPTKEEETRRFGIFKNTLKIIREKNEKYLKGESSFYFSVNEFADLEPEEHPNGLAVPVSYPLTDPASNGPEPLDTDEKEWEKFKVHFNKLYKTKEEETRRYNIFIKNLKAIREQNAKYLKHETGYYQGVNLFADLEEEERPHGVIAVDHTVSHLHKLHPDTVPNVYQPHSGLVSYKIKYYSGPIQRHQTGFIPDPNNKTPYHIEPLESDEKEWEKFKVHFGKTYPTKEEETRRFGIFKNTLKIIREKNEKYLKGESSFYFSVNEFADLEPEEHPNGLAEPVSYPLTDPVPNGPEPLDTDEKEWEKFKVRFGKVYPSKEEELRRFAIFKARVQGIREHNAKYLKHETSYYQEVNLFTDLEEGEQPKGLAHRIIPVVIPKPNQPLIDPIPIGPEPLESDEIEWEKFKKDFNRTSATPEEEEKRFKIFKGTLKTIREHNAKFLKKEVTWFLGVTPFADLTKQEQDTYTNPLLKQTLVDPVPDGPEPIDTDQREWEKFKVKFGKNYSSKEEENRRFIIFKSNLKGIREHNAKYLKHETSYYQGVNNFTDLEEGEHPQGLAYRIIPLVIPKPNQPLIDPIPIGPKPLESDEIEWEKFKKDFNRTYATPEEEEKRFKIFKGTLKTIREHNAKFLKKEVTWFSGVTPFADLTKQEQDTYTNPLLKQTLVDPVPDGPEPIDTDQREWEKFKVKFGKNYPSKEEENHRFIIFKSNLKGIREHNAKYLKHETSHYQGVNNFTDLEEGEHPQGLAHRIITVVIPKPNQPLIDPIPIGPEPLESDEIEWEKFKKDFNRTYATPEEEEKRFKIFKETLKTIREHNAKFLKKEVTWFLGVTPFADLTKQEQDTYTNPLLKQTLVDPVPDVPEPIDTDEREWEKFKVKFGKNYPSKEEENHRFIIFKSNLKGIREHNAKYLKHETSYYQGVNIFTDLEEGEHPQGLAHRIIPVVIPKPNQPLIDQIPIEPEPLKSDEIEWEKFKKDFNRTYATPEEEEKRFKIFKGTLKTIRENNAKFLKKEVTWYLGVTPFADLTKQEQDTYTNPLLKQTLVDPVPDVTEPIDTDEREWEKFKVKFGKHYPSKEEENHRFIIFKSNLKGIREHNAKYLKHETSYYQGVTNFTDLEEGEHPQGLAYRIIPVVITIPNQPLIDPIPIGPKPLESDEIEWEKFKKHFNRTYATPEEEEKRFKIFKGTLKTLREHNAKFLKKEVVWFRGVGPFADLTTQEKDSYYVPDGPKPIDTDEREWEKFKIKFGKFYKTKEEENQRFEIFKATLNSIRKQNDLYLKNKTKNWLKVNQFADLKPDEHPTGLLLPGEESGLDVIKMEPLESDEKEWEKFKMKFGKTYPTKEEEIHRFGIFKDTLKGIREHNAKYPHETSYYQTVNQFADLEEGEYPHGKMYKPHLDPVPTGAEPLESDEKEWEKFKIRFNKTYATPEEEKHRFETFKVTLAGIRAHNADYVQGINQFADLTPHELASKFLIHDYIRKPVGQPTVDVNLEGQFGGDNDATQHQQKQQTNVDQQKQQQKLQTDQQQHQVDQPQHQPKEQLNVDRHEQLQIEQQSQHQEQLQQHQQKEPLNVDQQQKQLQIDQKQQLVDQQKPTEQQLQIDQQQKNDQKQKVEQQEQLHVDQQKIQVDPQQKQLQVHQQQQQELVDEQQQHLQQQEQVEVDQQQLHKFTKGGIKGGHRKSFTKGGHIHHQKHHIEIENNNINRVTKFIHV